MSIHRAGLVALLLTACGGATTAPAGNPSSDASVRDVATGTAADDHDASATDASDAGLINDAAGEAATGDGATACGAATNVPSRQTIRIVVTNNAAADRYVVRAGNLCEPYAIANAANASVPLGLGFQCICECPRPAEPRATSLRRLAPGESTTLTWDATRLVTCEESVDCAKIGWPQQGVATQLVASSAPVDPGAYAVTVLALKSLPADCRDEGGDVTCSMSSPTPPGVGSTPPVIQTACPSDVAATATFDVPASGDASIAVAITD